MKFKDVEEAHPAYKEIDIISDAGMMKGYPDNTFRPDVVVTRGMLAIVIARVLGYKAPEVPVVPVVPVIVIRDPNGTITLPYNEAYRRFAGVPAKSTQYFKAILTSPCTTVSNQLAVTVTTPDVSPNMDLVVRRSMNGTMPWPLPNVTLATDVVSHTAGLGGLAGRIKTPEPDTYYIMLVNNDVFSCSFYINWRCF
jgi:hypothetical protein